MTDQARAGNAYVPPAPFAWNFCGTCGAKLAPAHDGEGDRPYCAACRRFYYRNPVPAACCFVTRDDGALLLTQRGVEPCRGGWSPPGGFVELGETTEEAALRELEEETGLRGGGLRLLGISTKASRISGGVLVVGYIVETWEGALRAGSDAMDVRFFLPEDRPPLPFSVHRELLALYDAGR